MERVLVTGATGFTGKYVVRRLAEAGYRVSAFVRPESRREAVEAHVGRFFVGDLSDTESLRRALEGQDILVNVGSLGFGHSEGVVSAVRQAGIGRAVYFSTTSLFTSLPAPSREVRLQAEEVIRESSPPWTIFRPTM